MGRTRKSDARRRKEKICGEKAFRHVVIVDGRRVVVATNDETTENC
jgi:hypothetical protein